jgi:hypothetical protein
MLYVFHRNCGRPAGKLKGCIAERRIVRNEIAGHEEATVGPPGGVGLEAAEPVQNRSAASLRLPPERQGIARTPRRLSPKPSFAIELRRAPGKMTARCRRSGRGVGPAAPPAKLSTRHSWCMGCFERQLQIAPHHTLVQVRTHGCGGRTPFLRWVHREYDQHGLPIARYDTVQQLEPGRFRIW